MSKVFEDYFVEEQSNMIAVCLDYAEDRLEKVYVYCSYEKNDNGNIVLYCDFFYKIKGRILDKAYLNDIVQDGEEQYDISPFLQTEAMLEMHKYATNIVELHKRYNREMPSEIKLTYDFLNGGVTGKSNYNLNGIDPKELFKQWMEEVRSKEEITEDSVSKKTIMSKLFGKKH